jgi:hypothetical protein
VLAVSYASVGETSSETQPSIPFVFSWMRRNRSAARVRSSRARSKKSSSPERPGRCLLADAGVVVATVLDRVVEDRRVRGESRDRQLVDVPGERPVCEQSARDVVEPEALARVVELLCRLHRAPFRGAASAGSAAS